MSSNQRRYNSLDEAILSHISRSKKLPRKKIEQHIKLSYSGQWGKREIKRSLKQLVLDEKLCMDDSEQYFVRSSADSSVECTPSEEKMESDDDSSEEQKSTVPIAQRMRKQPFDGLKATADTDTVKKSSISPQVDIDEEIRRLEAELAADSDSEGEEDGSCQGSGSENRKITFGQNTTYSFAKDRDDSAYETSDLLMDSSGLICLSESASERIEPLPASAMPQISRKPAIDEKKAKKRKRDEKEHAVNAGLKSAVEDLLSNYKTRSEVEQTPWYCRVCQYQVDGEADFLAHRSSEFHKTAMHEHQKKTYCRMCRKQMTSLVQFQEHLNSKPHREMLARKRAQQQGRGRGIGRGYERGGIGRGGGRGRGDASSKRQWC